MLGSAISAVAREPDFRGGRTDIDDSPPAPLDHGRQATLDGPVGTGEVDVEGRRPGFVQRFRHQFLRTDAGGVDQDIDRPECRRGTTKERVDGRVLAQVEGQKKAASAMGLDRRLCLGHLSIGGQRRIAHAADCGRAGQRPDGKIRTGRSQRQGAGTPDARGAARHPGDMARQEPLAGFSHLSHRRQRQALGQNRF